MTSWSLGTTELWEIVNLTGDTHPIHIHLVQFQLLNRQRVNIKRYQAAFDAAIRRFPPTTSRRSRSARTSRAN
jgi:FtsP/CotA-like multicopper oxidase with cupredoxin domain